MAGQGQQVSPGLSPPPVPPPPCHTPPEKAGGWALSEQKKVTEERQALPFGPHSHTAAVTHLAAFVTGKHPGFTPELTFL